MSSADDRFVIEHPEPLRTVCRCFQVCLYGCCGDDAYDINGWNLLEWLQANGTGLLLQALDQMDDLIELIGRHPGKTFIDGDYELGDVDGIEFYRRMQIEALRALYREAGPTIFDPSWLVPNGRAVEALARQMADGQRYETAGILADALEEAGCESPELLIRCRQPKVYASWVVQLLLLGADGVLARPIEPTPGPAANPAPTA